jgi:membrane protein DedA with SNARE-associated domain
MISVEHALSVVEPWIVAYGVTALFITILLDSFGVPLPSEIAIVSASVLAQRGDISILSVFAAAWSATALGNTIGYLIGRVGGRPLLARFGPQVGLTKDRFEKLAARVRRNGFSVIVFARFVWIVRQLNGVLAGALSMPLWRFVPANVIGAGLWVAVWALSPYFFATWFGLTSAMTNL